MFTVALPSIVEAEDTVFSLSPHCQPSTCDLIWADQSQYGTTMMGLLDFIYVQAAVAT